MSSQNRCYSSEVDLTMSTGILLSEEDPFRGHEHSGFPGSTHSVLSHSCVCGGAASMSHNLWRGKRSLHSWKQR